MNNYDISELRTLFDRSLFHAGRRSKNDCGKIIYSSEDIRETIPYKINKHGYRSEEFEKNNEVLILGCSQTFGSGMFNEFTWPDIFCNSTNKKYSRLAISGDSIGAQVYKAFKYFEEIGNPEIVLGLFPLYRLEYVSVPKKFVANFRSGNTEHEKLCAGIAYVNGETPIQFSKAPHDPEHVIPQEFVIFYNFMFIKMLEQYCKSNNIKFIWSIYDDKNIEMYMQSNPNILKNYLKTSDHFKDCKNKSEGCAIEFENHKLYSWGADYNQSKDLGHWGIHSHKHIAERFIDRYRKIENDKQY